MKDTEQQLRDLMKMMLEANELSGVQLDRLEHLATTIIMEREYKRLSEVKDYAHGRPLC